MHQALCCSLSVNLHMHQKAILMILDGWGIGRGDQSDAIAQANTPFIDSLFHSVPHCTLTTHGESVGLPEGQMGNSEVGHLNIGAGRIVYQMLLRINRAFKDESIQRLPAIQQLLSLAQEGKKIHLIGLLSDGGVHSHQEHLFELLKLFRAHNLDQQIYLHVFTDGRDTDPKSGLGFARELMKAENIGKAIIASVSGRYYAMDRDKRWERIALAWQAMTEGKGPKAAGLIDAIENSYENGITDEFILPTVICDQHGQANGLIEDGDVVFSFNFRTDRAREISMALSQQDFPDFGMHHFKLSYFTMTEYDKTFKNVEVVFGNEDLKMTLGEVISRNGLKQLRAAETEKYPHVTFFFSGGRETPFEGEDRLLIPSPKVATYDLQPEMSAPELRDGILKAIESETYDFMCINFANPDMVGHTGVMEAIKKAVEVVDGCTRSIVEAGLKKDYRFVIIADHGNADYARNEDGSPNTAHSTNPVPCFFVGCGNITPHSGILADVAPSVLKMMGLNQPIEMSGSSLF